MSEVLADRKCKACEGGVQPLTRAEAQRYQEKLATGWTLSTDGKSIHRAYKFKNFFRTMGFVNAVAFIANEEDHHPDLEAGYNYCNVRFTTHAVKGLSENDFICAAKIDRLQQ